MPTPKPHGGQQLSPLPPILLLGAGLGKVLKPGNRGPEHRGALLLWPHPSLAPRETSRTGLRLSPKRHGGGGAPPLDFLPVLLQATLALAVRGQETPGSSLWAPSGCGQRLTGPRDLLLPRRPPRPGPSLSPLPSPPEAPQRTHFPHQPQSSSSFPHASGDHDSFLIDLHLPSTPWLLVPTPFPRSLLESLPSGAAGPDPAAPTAPRPRGPGTPWARLRATSCPYTTTSHRCLTPAELRAQPRGLAGGADLAEGGAELRVLRHWRSRRQSRRKGARLTPLTAEGWSRAQPCKTLPWTSKPNSPGTYPTPVLRGDW